MALYRPYTSKDLDYFGGREAAEKLAAGLGGRVLFPDMDNQTPQTAIVQARLNGHDIEIDFLGHVLGVRPKALQDQVVELIVPYRRDAGGVEGQIAITCAREIIGTASNAKLSSVLPGGRRASPR